MKGKLSTKQILTLVTILIMALSSVGTAILSDGNAMFIWDFAFSEAFYLDGLNTWDEKYLNKKITVEGVLIQFIDGKSVIKDWEIIEPK